MSSGNISLLTQTVVAAGALAACRFITQAGAYPAAGAAAFGVTRTSAANAGDLVPTDVLGTAIAETGAAITKDAPLMVDGTGRVVPLTVGSKSPVAKSMEAAAGSGAFIEVLLVPSAGLVTPAS
nr:capsid cement protein [uncultured Acidovorax sp.]